ncbi:bifunctional polysaccharide deacetylase/glycosyltransferase family 2 protein [Paeniglutamicibacter sp. MACA_103]|uniref:bifunctional polysaccharide deacetylase/glycosyltransferase family 2 protein n=1 Tax=Paeniglutamicibacter sp. MACA_103 TaxID=3377337 RepID=UPI00389478D9
MSSARRAARTGGIGTHWVLMAAILLTLGLSLAVQGYMNHLSGIGDVPAPASRGTGNVPGAVSEGGPIVDPRGDGVRTATPADHSVALTFDDGPDPVWTPKILDVLREHGTHATFFVTGTAAIKHPELIRRMEAEGHEIGIQTLTHTDLATAPSWRRQLEVRGAQKVVAGITGHSPSLLRPPHLSGNAAITDAQWAAMDAAADDEGVLTVLSTVNSGDKISPGADVITGLMMQQGKSGQVVLMHDGGGNRSQTVEALSSALGKQEKSGHRFTTVGDSIGVDSTREASVVDTLIGKAFIWGIRFTDAVVVAISWALVAAGVVTLMRVVLVMIVAARHRRAERRKREAERDRGFFEHPMRTEVLEPVSVIVPAYNEAAGIEAAVRSIAASSHPVQVIVVDDGSTDDTADIVEALGLPNVELIRKENGGKPSALNAGIAAARHDIVVMVDGDTVFELDTVQVLIQRFADPRVGAISGNTKIANRGGILGAWQHIEYVVGFNLDRRLFDVAECMPTVPGAIGAFRREALAAVGGVSDDTLAEDTDLTMALCRDGWRVVYEDEARAWTEAPATLGALWKQRYRWCYGTLQAMWKHRGAVAQGGAAGKLGRRGLGYLMLFQVLLPLFAPVVDVFAIYGLVFLDPVRIAALWLGFLLIQFIMAAYAFRLDREPIGPLWTVPLQQFVYRQMMYLVVIQSVVTALAGVRLRWHRMQRYGSLRVPAGAEGRS